MAKSNTTSPRRHGAVSQKHVLYSEILAVTSAMRKNSRWADSTFAMTARDSALASSLGLRRLTSTQNMFGSSRPTREVDLMAGFQKLKRMVRDVDDISSLPLPTLLGPFFAIIRSPLSTGPITSTALSSLHSLFVCKLISPHSIILVPALTELSSTISHCKFEASDSSGDEVVLLKIMTVIQDCMCGDVGNMLGDVEICEMLETVLTTCCQMRLSETLRRFSESSMHMLVRVVFSRLYELDPVAEEKKLQINDEDTADDELKMTLSIDAMNPENHSSESVSGGDVTAPAAVSVQEAQIASRPQYGLPSIIELLRVLINILDPNDQLHTDSTRSTALSILNAAFEEAGSRIPDFSSLMALVIDPGCKYLFQLARSENIAVLHLALRTISVVFATMRKHLKLQHELFLAFTIDRLAPPIQNGKGQRAGSSIPKPKGGQGLSQSSTPSSTPFLGPIADSESEKGMSTPSRVLVPPAQGETRELMLETLSQISTHPSFMVNVYMNYDCDINCENVFERLIDFITKGVYSTIYTGFLEGQQQNSQLLCLDMLLAFVNDMALRAEGFKDPWPEDYIHADELLRQKSRKKLVLTGAARFNAKPKTALAFLEENKLIYADLSSEVSHAKSLAIFLKNCTRLDKRLLGDFISKPENIDVLRAFIGLFDFRDKPIADAMRQLLETFRLPGEAQQISRITETFASIYFSAGPAEIKSEDAVYILAYSVILLNTDLHNPQIRKRMSIEDYRKNLRGVNGGSDFSPEFLQEVYDSIRKREIIMPEEHTGQLGFEYAWKELLMRSRQSGDYMVCNTDKFDVDMFKSVWRPAISAIAYAFISFNDDYVIQRAISGFKQCATLAGCFKLPDIFDYVVVSLSQATSLLSDNIPTQVPVYPVVDVDNHTITVSSLSVNFGTNFKGQLAAVVLFNIVNGNGNALREGWTQIFEMFQNLFLHSLLPTRMLQMEDFLGGVSMIPLRGSQPPPPAARGDGGLLSALSSYLMTPYGTSTDNLVPDTTESDIESTLCTIDCITSCRLDELYSQILLLDLDAFVAAIRALEALAHERTVARLKQESDDISSSFDVNMPANDSSYCLPYDPASVFLLETMVSVTCQTPQYIEDVWPIVFEHLSALLSTSTQYSILLIERAVVGLLRLCLIFVQKPALRDQIYLSLDLLAGLPPVVATSVAEQIAAGVVLLVRKHREVIRSQTEWKLVFALLRSTISHPEAAQSSYDLVASLASDGPERCVNSDNFSALLTVLEDFVVAAGLTVQNQQLKGRRNQQLNISNSPQIDRGRKSIDLISGLKKFIPSSSSGSDSAQVWDKFSLPLLVILGRHCANASREIRHTSMSQLQRLLLSPHLILNDADGAQVEDIFTHVIFPLTDDISKPEVQELDPQGMPETRLRASTLLCKTFMHFKVRDGNIKSDIQQLWIHILNALDRFMNIDKSGQLHEAIPESLKNVLLVMNATETLVPPLPGKDNRSERQKALWAATFDRIERFLPGFLPEIIPGPVETTSEFSNSAPAS